MADKKITDLQLRSNVTDDLNFATDDGIQSYRVTGAQTKSYVKTQALAAVSATGSVGADTETELVDSSGGAVTRTLPSASSKTGKIVTIKKVSSGNNWVTIAASDNIDGQSTYVLHVANEFVSLLSDGTTWLVTSKGVVRPYFHAYLGSNQSVATGVGLVKLLIDTEVSDTHGWYDSATNYRFTPKKPGVYRFTANMFVSGATNRIDPYIRKNGTDLYEGPSGYQGDLSCGVSIALPMNGSTDYVEVVTVNNSSGSKDYDAGDGATYFQGELVAEL